MKEPPHFGAIAVAGPVTSDAISLTNSTWSFTIEELRRATGLDDTLVSVRTREDVASQTLLREKPQRESGLLGRLIRC